MLKFFIASLFMVSFPAYGYEIIGRPEINTVSGIKGTGYLGRRYDINAIPYDNKAVNADDLPLSFDSREVQAMPEIRDQGNCGSCWAFAATRALEISLAKSNGNVLDLSEQEMVSCETSAYKCEGGFMESAKFLLKGIASEESWPYAAKSLRCKKLPKAAKAVKMKLLGSEEKQPTVEQIKSAILNYGSAFVTVAVGNTGWSGATGEIKGKGCDNEATNHMVVVVGWTFEDQWIMGNSWGPEWGNKGHALIKFGCANIGEEAGYVVAGDLL